MKVFFTNISEREFEFGDEFGDNRNWILAQQMELLANESIPIVLLVKIFVSCLEQRCNKTLWKDM